MSRLRAYAQLVRLPNVFTAWADIVLAVLAAGAVGGTSSRPGMGWSAAWALLASTALYWAGMVWNDFFDVEQDRRERPFRPIPSGRIARRTAAGLGTALLSVGVGAAALAGWRDGSLEREPILVAGFLSAAIILYDGWLKRTWAGPVGMGACRSLNVLLGLSAVGESGAGWGIHMAVVVGVYIAGVTWFARTEAATSRRPALAGAAGVMLAALVLALPLPLWFPPGTSSVLFPYLLVALGFAVGFPVWQAVERPRPERVQRAVRRAIFGLVGLDATLATALAGPVGLLVLLLLPPGLWVGRWIYST